MTTLPILRGVADSVDIIEIDLGEWRCIFERKRPKPTQLIILATQGNNQMANSFLSSKGPISFHVFEADEAGNIIGPELPETEYDLVLTAGTGAAETLVGNALTPATPSDVSTFSVAATEIAPGENVGLTGSVAVSLTDTVTQLVIQVTQP